MENSYHIRMSLFPNLNSDRHSDSVISFRLKVEYSLCGKKAFFHSKRSHNTKKFFIFNEIRRTVLKNRILHCFKRRHSEKNFVANEHHSFTFVFIFSVLVVDLPTDGILSFLFAAETDVLVQVFFQSTDVVVINFVVVLKFFVVQHATTIVRLVCLFLFLSFFFFAYVRLLAVKL